MFDVVEYDLCGDVVEVDYDRAYFIQLMNPVHVNIF